MKHLGAVSSLPCEVLLSLRTLSVVRRRVSGGGLGLLVNLSLNAIPYVLTVLKTPYSNVYSCHGIFSMGIPLTSIQGSYPEKQQN